MVVRYYAPSSSRGGTAQPTHPEERRALATAKAASLRDMNRGHSGSYGSGPPSNMPPKEEANEEHRKALRQGQRQRSKERKKEKKGDYKEN